MYKVLIVDDVIEQCKALESILESHNEPFEIDICTDLESAKISCAKNKYDLFLLDMRLDTDSTSADEGLELGIYIRSLPSYTYTPIVYITSVPEKIYQALSNTNCFDYVLKPYTAIHIHNKLDTILKSPLIEEQTVRFRTSYGVDVILKASEIMYVTSAGHRVTIHTYDDEIYTYCPLKFFEEQLSHSIYRCRNNCLININYVTSYDHIRNIITLGDNLKQIPVARSQRKLFENIMRKEL